MSDRSDASPDRAAQRRIWLSPGPVWTLGTSTFTQLVRMRTFYFLLVFAVLVVGASNLNLLFTPAQQLKVIKDTSFGAMALFSWTFAIAATAMLIPRDLEDRTLYTILSKPVSRIEYLLGKLCGVMLVLAVALGFMFLIFTVVLWLREVMILAEARASLAQTPGLSDEDRAAQLDLVREQGVGWHLLAATWAVFLKASVVASVTILVSTFASSSLFTIIVSGAVFLIGHFHKMAVAFWLHELDDNLLAVIIGKAISLLIPDFQVFNVVEAIVAGEAFAPFVLVQLTGLALLYLVIYTLVSLLIFFDKEF